MNPAMKQAPSGSSLFRIIGQPLAMLALVLALGGVLVYWSAQRTALVQQAYEADHAAREQARERLSRVDEERRLIERYGPAYRLLSEQGIIGAEQRVNWLDALRLASQATHGFGVDYQVSGQGSLTGTAQKLDAGAFGIQQSEMKLRLRLLHEGDLFEFLRALDEQRAGLHLLRACTLQRIGSGAFSARYEPKLQAECQMMWITLDDRTLRGTP